MREYVELGIGREARRTYHLDEVSVVPSRRTRSSKDVHTGWKLDAYELTNPFIAHPTDALVSFEFAVEMDRQGGFAVLDAEGLLGRVVDLDAAIAEIAGADNPTQVLQRLHQEPIDLDLLASRIEAVRAAGALVAVRVSPQHARELAPQITAHLLFIQGTVVSAEHVERGGEPLNLKEFIGALDTAVVVGGVSSYHTAKHAMRAGAVGVVVGSGETTNAVTVGIDVPMATAIADVAAARRDYLDETGGRHVAVIADGEIYSTGDAVKAIACGADAVMLGMPLAQASEAQGAGLYWEAAAAHPVFPRAEVLTVTTAEDRLPLEQVLHGPAANPLGEINYCGALKRAMGKCGYTDLKAFQRVELNLV
ncbi:MAG: GuaB3 family IMP dehydrogenase-related protein [Corynebacterium sp.]|nr:GuaB3 family IMP dehydrogenase-related protein [Corynebacterium sp.]